MTDLQAITVREARREDVAAIVALLADDDLGRGREDPAAMPDYLSAYERVAADRRNLLYVAEDAAGSLVGTFQMTLIPGLSNRGAELALIQAVRITSDRRGQGLGEAMISWAMDEARRRGATTVELFTHNSRDAAQRFYERLGFARSHVGMRRRL